MLCNVPATREKKSLPQEAHKYVFSVYFFSRFSLSHSIGVDIERGTRNAIGTNNIDHLLWLMYAHWYRNYAANASYLKGYIFR